MLIGKVTLDQWEKQISEKEGKDHPHHPGGNSGSDTEDNELICG